MRSVRVTIWWTFVPIIAGGYAENNTISCGLELFGMGVTRGICSRALAGKRTPFRAGAYASALRVTFRRNTAARR